METFNGDADRVGGILPSSILFFGFENFFSHLIVDSLLKHIVSPSGINFSKPSRPTKNRRRILCECIGIILAFYLGNVNIILSV
jgi:hypothetical protein